MKKRYWIIGGFCVGIALFMFTNPTSNDTPSAPSASVSNNEEEKTLFFNTANKSIDLQIQAMDKIRNSYPKYVSGQYSAPLTMAQIRDAIDLGNQAEKVMREPLLHDQKARDLSIEILQTYTVLNGGYNELLMGIASDNPQAQYNALAKIKKSDDDLGAIAPKAANYLKK